MNDLDKNSILYKHLEKYKDVLSSRREVINNIIAFYQLQWPREVSIFKGPKIVAPQRSTKNTFGYNEIDWYASADVYFITTPKRGYNLKYVLGLLNSKLYYFWFYYKGKRKGETLELYQQPLSEVPIKLVPAIISEKIEKLVDEIIFAKESLNSSVAQYKETELDKEIYSIFELSEEEIKKIESFQ